VPDTPGLPPGIQVIETTPQRPLELPKFPYRSLNTTAINTTFGALQIGASFFYKLIAFYKVAKETALSTSTGINYLFSAVVPVKEIVFPEVGETIEESGHMVITGVIGGSESMNKEARFYYRERESSFYALFTRDAVEWVDAHGNPIRQMNATRKTFICR
jgi:hypothetical protein